jgi:hypothetical protein
MNISYSIECVCKAENYCKLTESQLRKHLELVIGDATPNIVENRSSLF